MFGSQTEKNMQGNILSKKPTKPVVLVYELGRGVQVEDRPGTASNNWINHD